MIGTLTAISKEVDWQLISFNYKEPEMTQQ